MTPAGAVRRRREQAQERAHPKVRERPRGASNARLGVHAGVPVSRIRVSDLMLVDHAGEIVIPPAQAKPRLNRAAFAIHSELHKARPDVVAAGLFPSGEAAIGAVIGETPLGRLGEVADMADAVVFLASDAARFITGAGLPIDGGMGM